MKKLMIAAAIVCAAVATQAATCNWNAKQKENTYIYEMGSDYCTEYSGSMYLICTETISQSALLSAIRDGGSLSGYAKAATITVDGGAFSTKTFTTDATPEQEYSFYAVIQDGDNLFLSDSSSGTATEQASGAMLSFDLDHASGDGDTVFGKANFSEGGWYNAEAVPEPFSGTLALLGMGAIALRRKLRKAKK